MRSACYILAMTAVCFSTATYSSPRHVQTVTTARLVKAARAALPAADAGMTITTRVLGAPPDTTVGAGVVRLQTHHVLGRWPRARVAVPVVVLVDGRPSRSETVWFAVRALRTAWVYAQDAPAGTEMGELKMHKGTVDVAKADGRVVDALTTLTGDRLKRGVQSGWPVLLSDFEPVPDVDRQSQVVVHVRYGAVRIKTLGRALDAGDVGDVIPVLVEGAASSVLAKVTGKGVVDIAR